MQIEIKSKEKLGFETENKLLIERIKELESENVLYFKWIADLSNMMADKANEMNQLHEQIQKRHI